MNLPELKNSPNATMAPGQMNAHYATLFNAGAVDALLRLYADDAKLIAADGTERVGTNAIRQELARYLALGGTMDIENRYAIEFGRYALLGSD